MVGDLFETEKEKGKLWLWLSVFGVALSLFWRRPVAFWGALFVTAQTMQFFFTPTMRNVLIGHLQDHSGHTWWIWVLFEINMVAPMLCILSVYAAIRYGLRERTMQMALAWTAICAAALYFCWQPNILAVCAAVSLCFVIASMWTSKRRMESAVVFVAVAILYAGNSLTYKLSDLYQQYLHRGLWSDRDYQEHPSYLVVMTCSYILSFFVGTSAWSYLRDRLMRRQLLESNAEML